MSALLEPELVAGLYEAAHRPEMWPEAMSRVARAFDSPQAVAGWTDLEGRRVPVFRAHGLSEDDIRSYTPDLWEQDPRAEFFRTARAGAMLVSGRNDDPDAVFASEVGQRYYRKRANAYWYGGVVARRSNQSLVGFSVQRPPSMRMFDDGQLDAVRMMGAHLDHVLRLAQRHHGEAIIEALRGTALDSFAHGVVLVDRLGQVVECNSAARAILQRKDGLVLAMRRLGTRNPSEAAQLQRLLLPALERAAHGLPHPGGTMRVSRKGGQAPYLVAVMPSRVGDVELIGATSGAVVLIRDSSAGAAIDLEALRSAYGLTLAEARIAAQLLLRPGLVSVARSLNIAHETARQHLKRINQKTGCANQAELVAMLAADLPLLTGTARTRSTDDAPQTGDAGPKRSA